MSEKTQPTPENNIPLAIEFKSEREIKLFILVVIALSDGTCEATEQEKLTVFGQKIFPLELSYFQWLLKYYFEYRAAHKKKAEELVVEFCKSEDYFSEEQKKELLQEIIELIEADGKVSFSEGVMLRKVKYLLVH